MRSFKGARGRPVALASLAQDMAKFVLDLGRRHVRDAPLRACPSSASTRIREGRIRPRASRVRSIRAASRAQRHRDGPRRSPCPASAICSSSPSNRARASLAHLEQPVPLPHGAVVAAERRCASSASTASTSRSRKRRRSDAEPVNSPSMAGISQTSLTCSASAPALCVLAGDAHRPSLALLDAAGGKAGADLDLVLARHDLGRDGEAAGAVLAAELGIGTGAQAMTRRRAATPLRADWSCPSRYRRSAPPAAHRA